MFHAASLFRRALHAVLPIDCAGCGQSLWDDPVPFFCRPCWGQITPLHDPVCPRCSRPFASSISLLHSPFHRCRSCRVQPPAYTKAWTLYPYAPPLKEAIRLLKYHGKLTLAGPLANLMVAAFPQLPDIDLILPVPLHPSRLREREYNQSLLLADHLSRHLNIPLSYNNLVRVRHSRPQTALQRAARLKNLRRTFAVNRADRVVGKRVLVIDDVFTTGTTVNECAKTLRKAGAADVYVGTLARMV